MKNSIKIVSWLSLAAMMIPVILFLIGGGIELNTVKTIMSICTIVWFVTASMWMWNSDANQA
ncbi:MAG: hypothetical protein GX455_08755 [Phycisphaerae bacterium]|nr:hypothetical protein [Phycisphaerae bacterium]